MRSLKTKFKQFLKKKKEKLEISFKTGYLQCKSREFSKLFPKEVKIRRLATGFEFTEGPVWFAEGQYLLFSDIPASTIYQLTTHGQVKVFRQCSNQANGLTRDKQGRLIACEHQTRQVTRTEKDGSITVLANQFQGKPLNSPNDVVVRNDGLIYFTDPSFGIKPKQQKQPVQGVYCLNPDTQKLILVADDFERPNGLAFSPNQTKLYLDDSFHHHLRVFEVQENGMLTNGQVFADLKINRPGCPDGMKIDIQGNIYCTGAGGIWVFNPNGEHLGTIVTPEIPANCAWGDKDWQGLYITARTSIYKVCVNIPGFNYSAL